MPAKRSPPQQLRQLGDVGGEAVALWGKAGQRSLARSALVEAVEQLTRALDLIASLTATPAIRREQIKLQVALITPLIHVKGYAAPETKEAAERARLLIEQASAAGELPEDPLLLFSVLYGFWVANYVAFNGEVVRELAAQFLVFAQKQTATVPLMVEWDGTKWTKASSWIESIKDKVLPLIDSAASSYVGANTGWPKRTELATSRREMTRHRRCDRVRDHRVPLSLRSCG
jgi:hypothetical protein